MGNSLQKYYVIFLTITHDLLLRWLYVNRRRLAWEKVQRKQKAKQAQSEKDQAADSGGKPEQVSLEVPEIKIFQIID